MIKNAIQYLALGALLSGLSACSSINTDEWLPDKAIEYKREKAAEKNLEVPPDLTSERINDKMSVPDNQGGVSASYSEYQTDRSVRGQGVRSGYDSSVLPQLREIDVVRDGKDRWLVVQGPVENVWSGLLDFWQENGILLVEQDPGIGVMRTSWLENRANIKSDIITDSIRSVFDGIYEAGTRDQYRVRLERGAAGTTEVYLTHFGMQEELGVNTLGDANRSLWIPRERDPGLEAEMLRRIMVYLGAADAKARSQLAGQARGDKTARSQLVRSDQAVKLLVDENFSRAWRLVGLALDRVGFSVEDRDRSAGIYYVRYNDPGANQKEEGWLSKIDFWSKTDVPKNQRYQVRVVTEGERSVVHVMDDKATVLNTPTAIRILNLLQEQLR